MIRTAISPRLAIRIFLMGMALDGDGKRIIIPDFDPGFLTGDAPKSFKQGQPQQLLEHHAYFNNCLDLMGFPWTR